MVKNPIFCLFTWLYYKNTYENQGFLDQNQKENSYN